MRKTTENACWILMYSTKSRVDQKENNLLDVQFHCGNSGVCVCVCVGGVVVGGLGEGRGRETGKERREGGGWVGVYMCSACSVWWCGV